MKVLVVYSNNSNRIAPFILEQVHSLELLGIETELFGIVGKGLKGYLSNRKKLLKRIRRFRPNIIHAHYGLSGFLANMQRKVPVITTYHGSDINSNKVYYISRLVIKLSKHNIFVSQKNIDKAKVKKNYSLIPCGVDTNIFYPQDKIYCREKMNLDSDKKYVLFSGSFDNEVKNALLAQEVVAEIENIELIELKGYSREQVACLMNAVDVCLMTSYSEGSPQFIKEAMACNSPIVSVDVGDVKEVLDETNVCRVVNKYVKELIVREINTIFGYNERSNGRERITKLAISLEEVACRIKNIYDLQK